MNIKPASNQNFPQYSILWDRKEGCTLTQDKNYIIMNIKGQCMTYNAFEKFSPVPHNDRIYIAFANIDFSQSGDILNFYNTYGFLYTRIGIIENSKNALSEVYQENLAQAKNEHSVLVQILNLYALILKASPIDSETTTKEIVEFVSRLDFGKLKKPIAFELLRQLEIVELGYSLFEPQNIWKNEKFKEYTGEEFGAEIIKDGNEKYWNKYKTLSTAKKLLCHLVNEKIDSPKFKLKVEKGRFVQHIHCTSLVEIMYLQLYIDIINNRVIKKCANEKCKNFLVVRPSNKKKEYCCRNCVHAKNQRDERRTEDV